MRSRFVLGAVVIACAALLSHRAAFAEDVALLPSGLMAPSSKEMIPAGKFKPANEVVFASTP